MNKYFWSNRPSLWSNRVCGVWVDGWMKGVKVVSGIATQKQIVLNVNKNTKKSKNKFN